MSKPIAMVLSRVTVPAFMFASVVRNGESETLSAIAAGCMVLVVSVAVLKGYDCVRSTMASNTARGQL